MFMYSKWNGSKTYDFGNNERDFGTDYGICCWYTPQLNFSAIPDGPDTDWAYWFNSVPKGAKTGKDNGFRKESNTQCSSLFLVLTRSRDYESQHGNAITCIDPCLINASEASRQ